MVHQTETHGIFFHMNELVYIGHHKEESASLKEVIQKQAIEINQLRKLKIQKGSGGFVEIEDGEVNQIIKTKGDGRSISAPSSSRTWASNDVIRSRMLATYMKSAGTGGRANSSVLMYRERKERGRSRIKKSERGYMSDRRAQTTSQGISWSSDEGKRILQITREMSKPRMKPTWK